MSKIRDIKVEIYLVLVQNLPRCPFWSMWGPCICYLWNGAKNLGAIIPSMVVALETNKKLEFLNMANIGGLMHLQEPKSGSTGYPLQPRSPLGIVVSSQASNVNKGAFSCRVTVHVTLYSYKTYNLRLVFWASSVLQSCWLVSYTSMWFSFSPEEEVRVRIMKNLCQIGRSGGDQRLRLECLRSKLQSMNVNSCSYHPGGGSAHNNGLYGEAPPERGTFFRLQVYKRVGISQV